MPRHGRPLLCQHEASFAIQDSDNRQADRHESGLSILCQGQPVLRPLEHQPAQRLGKRIVDLLENLASNGKGGAQLTPHAHGLAALPGENERPLHP